MKIPEYKDHSSTTVYEFQHLGHKGYFVFIVPGYYAFGVANVYFGIFDANFPAIFSSQQADYDDIIYEGCMAIEREIHRLSSELKNSIPDEQNEQSKLGSDEFTLLEHNSFKAKYCNICQTSPTKENKVDICGFISRYVDLIESPVSRYWYGSCPFCNEVDSLLVDPFKELFFCIECDRAGDVISFYKYINNIGRVD